MIRGSGQLPTCRQAPPCYVHAAHQSCVCHTPEPACLRRCPATCAPACPAPPLQRCPRGGTTKGWATWSCRRCGWRGRWHSGADLGPTSCAWASGTCEPAWEAAGLRGWMRTDAGCAAWDSRTLPVCMPPAGSSEAFQQPQSQRLSCPLASAPAPAALSACSAMFLTLEQLRHLMGAPSAPKH